MTKTEMLMNRSAGAGRMKRDIIYRQDAIDALDCINGTEEVLRSLPSAQPKQNLGKWVDDGDPLNWVCSECGYRVAKYNNTPYCPNCGKYMG